MDRAVQSGRRSNEYYDARRKAERPGDPSGGVWCTDGPAGDGTRRRRSLLAPFFETAIEHVWGGVWNRPGLELKYRSLVVVSVLAATRHNEELKAHLRGALNLGWTVDELREALLQTAPYAGFSAANEALQALSAVATQD